MVLRIDVAVYSALGLLDGTHTPYARPADSAKNYFNRKGFHSVIMQAVAFHHYFLTDIWIDWPSVFMMQESSETQSFMQTVKWNTCSQHTTLKSLWSY